MDLSLSCLLECVWVKVSVGVDNNNNKKIKKLGVKEGWGVGVSGHIWYEAERTVLGRWRCSHRDGLREWRGTDIS